MKVRWRILFAGRVQGVGFRYTARYAARALYLTGWVRNLWDGDVEMEVQGDISQIRKLLIQLKGERYIRIERMDIEEMPLDENEKQFTVK